MAKELGKKLSKTFIEKVSNNFYLTNHASERIKERRIDLWDEDINVLVANIGKEIRNCSYAFNNNNNSISVVLHDGRMIVLEYSDFFKRWQLITLKDLSANGYTPADKHQIAKIQPASGYYAMHIIPVFYATGKIKNISNLL